MKSVQKHSQTLRLGVSSLIFFLLITFNLSAQGDVKAGKSLFNANCAACHKLDKKLVGPALGKISERRELPWLKAWIRNNNALRASGDADAIAIYEEYNGAAMSAFPQLSDADLVNLIAYMDADPVKKNG
jgi:mono/diheme cytochrome c family protein